MHAMLFVDRAMLSAQFLMLGVESGQCGKEDAPALHASPGYGRNSWCQHSTLGGYFPSTKTTARWAEGFHDGLNGFVFDLERDGLRQVVLCPRLTMR